MTGVEKKYVPHLKAIDIALTPRLIAEFGASGAVVLKQIQYWGEYYGGWFEASSWDLADYTGLGPDACRREVKKLVERGAVEKEIRVTGQGMQKCRYRLSPVGRRLAIPPGRPGDSAGPGPGDSARPTFSGDERKIIPPSPLEGGEVEPELSAPEQPGLFGPGAGGAVTVGERKARAGGAVDDRIRGAYASWAGIRYPKGDRGNRVKGERALAKAFREGATMAEIDRQTANYAAARVAFHDAWAHVGNYWPALMNASTFLNGKRELFDEGWTREDLRYWPAPAGWSWDDLAVTCHDAVAADDVPADVRAEGGLAVAMWRAKHRDAGAVAGG